MIAPKRQRSPLTPQVTQAALSHSGPSSSPFWGDHSFPSRQFLQPQHLLFQAPHLPFPEFPPPSAASGVGQSTPPSVSIPNPLTGSFPGEPQFPQMEPRGLLLHRSEMIRPPSQFSQSKARAPRFAAHHNTFQMTPIFPCKEAFLLHRKYRFSFVRKRTVSPPPHARNAGVPRD